MENPLALRENILKVFPGASVSPVVVDKIIGINIVTENITIQKFQIKELEAMGLSFVSVSSLESDKKPYYLSVLMRATPSPLKKLDKFIEQSKYQ